MLFITLFIILFHIKKATFPKQATILILVIALLGGVFDQSLNYFHFIDYKNQEIMQNLIPLWIVMLWALFATTLTLSMRWLRSNIILSAIFGFVGGPLSYMAGEKLNAIHIEGQMGLLILALGWAIAIPLCIQLSIKWDGYPP